MKSEANQMSTLRAPAEKYDAATARLNIRVCRRRVSISTDRGFPGQRENKFSSAEVRLTWMIEEVNELSRP